MPFCTTLASMPQDVRSPIERILEWSAALPIKQAVARIATLWTLTVVIDAATGRLVSLNALYLLPLCLTTWCFGRVWGFLTGLIAVGVTLQINGFGDGLSAQATSVPPAIALWNATMRIAGVAFLILLVDAFRRTFDRERLHARQDPLTGLGNRRAFTIESHKLALAATRENCTLLCGLIDIDDFKKVNDSYGHAIGDQILAAAADALRASVSPYDSTARIGGDELAFCAMVRDVTSAKNKAAEIHQRVSSALARAVVPATCSLGATAGNPSERALELADCAMYAAKAERKGTWKFLEKPT